MTRRRAVLAMVVVTLLWSMAGVVTRQLESARSFEVAFWRSLFLVAALALFSCADGGPLRHARGALRGGRTLWISGLAWGVMFTAFMVALTLTTVANALVTMALAPFLSAFCARVAFGERIGGRTAGAALVAGLGIVWMFAHELEGSDARHRLGFLIALAVPAAAAVNWTVIRHGTRAADAPDLRVAVAIGGLLSAVGTLPFALPFQASGHDLAWLALLGVAQLALPCLLAVEVARVLSAPEVALIDLLEIVLGVAWAWLGAGETPPASALLGGALVVGALVANEALALRAE